MIYLKCETKDKKFPMRMRISGKRLMVDVFYAANR